MSRKRTYTPKAFESMGEHYTDQTGKRKADTSANIYESMMTSPAFLDLNMRLRNLYLVCKAQHYGKRKPGKDFPEIEDFQGADIFYLNWGTVLKYGIYKESMHGNFYSDMKTLMEHGFIKRISSGKSHRTKSIYQFSGDWKTWRAEQ